MLKLALETYLSYFVLNYLFPERYLQTESDFKDYPLFFN